MDYLFVGPHLEHTSEGKPVFPYDVVSLDSLKDENEALTAHLIPQNTPAPAPARSPEVSA